MWAETSQDVEYCVFWSAVESVHGECTRLVEERYPDARGEARGEASLRHR